MRLSYQTQQEVDTFEDEVTLSSGVKFDQRNTVEMINSHKRGKFYDCSDPDAIFWPLGIDRAVHFAKKLDIDTRHLQVEGYGDFNYYQAWATNIRFRKWSRDTNFALDLDDVGDNATDFGSGIMKLTERKGGGFDVGQVDLMKMWFDPTKEFYKEVKIELHELAEHEVMGKPGWKNKQKSWDLAETVDDEETEKNDAVDTVNEKRKYWERVGYFNVAHYKKGNLNEKYLEEEVDIKDDNGQKEKGMQDIPVKNKWEFVHSIHSSTGGDEQVVFWEVLDPDDDLYVDLHISKYEDRWMRVGVYERLFGLQRMTNEAVNYNRQTQQIASLLLFKSKNIKLVGSNILKEAESGLITDADLDQMGITNQFFTEFIATLQAYEVKADKICLTPDALRGEANERTFRGLAAQINMANSAFKKSRDRMLSVISKMLVDRILPHEVKDWNKEKSLEISGFEVDIRMYDAIAVIRKLNAWLKEKFAKGNNPSQEDKQIFVQKLMETVEREGRTLKLPEKFYNFDFGLSINPAGESENKEQMNDVYFNVINWVLSSPVVTTIPAFREYCEKNFITPCFHFHRLG